MCRGKTFSNGPVGSLRDGNMEHRLRLATERGSRGTETALVFLSTPGHAGPVCESCYVRQMRWTEAKQLSRRSTVRISKGLAKSCMYQLLDIVYLTLFHINNNQTVVTATPTPLYCFFGLGCFSWTHWTEILIIFECFIFFTCLNKPKLVTRDIWFWVFRHSLTSSYICMQSFPLLSVGTCAHYACNFQYVSVNAFPLSAVPQHSCACALISAWWRWYD